jgi:hypothetical protein
MRDLPTFAIKAKSEKQDVKGGIIRIRRKN